MNTNRSKLLGSVLALVVAFSGVGFAGATLTMDATSIAGSSTVAITSNDWGISATGVMTGIGNITSNGSLVLNGTVTNGIDLTGATLTQDPDNALFSIGSTGAPKVLPQLTASYIPVQTYLESQINPTVAVDLIGGYFKVSNSTVDQANLQLVGIAPRVIMGKNASDAYGTQSHLTLTAGAQAIGNMTAVSGKTILGGATTTGIVSAGLFTVEGNTVATATSTGYGVWADITNGAQVTSIFEGNVNDANSSAATGLKLNGAITTGINMSGVTGMTTDIVLSSGATIKTGTGAGSGACTLGSLYISTDNAKLYICTVITGTWTVVGSQT